MTWSSFPSQIFGQIKEAIDFLPKATSAIYLKALRSGIVSSAPSQSLFSLLSSVDYGACRSLDNSLKSARWWHLGHWQGFGPTGVWRGIQRQRFRSHVLNCLARPVWPRQLSDRDFWLRSSTVSTSAYALESSLRSATLAHGSIPTALTHCCCCGSRERFCSFLSRRNRFCHFASFLLSLLSSSSSSSFGSWWQNSDRDQAWCCWSCPGYWLILPRLWCCYLRLNRWLLWTPQNSSESVSLVWPVICGRSWKGNHWEFDSSGSNLWADSPDTTISKPRTETHTGRSRRRTWWLPAHSTVQLWPTCRRLTRASLSENLICTFA